MDSRELVEKIKSIDEMSLVDLDENGRRRKTSANARTSANRKTSADRKASSDRKASASRKVSANRRASVKRKAAVNTKASFRWPALFGNRRKHSKQYIWEIPDKGRTPAIIAAACLLAFAVAGIGYALWYNSFTKVKLSDYASVTLSGYDNHGSAELDMSENPEYSEFFQTVKADLNNSENLSNGDELTITYVYDEDAAKENKLRVDDSEAHVTVSGLAEAKQIDHDDIFSGLNVTFDGISPLVTVTMENTSSDAPFSDITYSIVDDKSFYDGGDEISVCAQIPEEVLSDPAYSFNLSEDDYYSSYTIPYGDRYFTDASQVSDDILDELEQKGFELISQSNAKEYGLRIFQGEAKLQPLFVGNNTTFQWANPYVISAYFHSVTDEGKSLLESHANDVQIVYGVTLTQADGTSVLTEMVIQFVDLLTHEDGTIDNAADSGRIVSVSYKDSNIKSLINDSDSGTYVTTKLTE